MKKFIYLFILSSSATLFAQAPQNRKVLWVHGLGNNIHFWDQQRTNAQRNYRIRSSGSTHPTNEGVQKYADRLREDLNPIKGDRTIGVGHSLGAVALRQANKDDNSLFGGIITLGAPLDGARLANAVISGEADRFIRQSVDILQRGPILSKSRTGLQTFKDTFLNPIPSPLLILWPSNLIRLFGSGYALEETQKLADNANKAIFDRFNPNNPSVRDLAENSSYLRSIRNFQSSQAKIIAWGNEDSPVHVRLMASGKSLNTSSNRKMLRIYNLVGAGYRMAANGIRTGWGFLCWRSCMRRRRAEKEAWNAGYDYLRRGWEIAWNELTGARHLEEYTTTERTYVCDGGGISPFQMIPFYRQPGCSYGFYYNPFFYSYTPCNPCRWEYRTVTRHRWVNNPSDGMIKASSQKGEVTNWHGGERKFVELKGVNHMEMGVHEQSDKLFRDAFNGKHGKFFETDKR